MQEPFAQLIERTFSGAERVVIYRLIQGPRDVRHFAPNPIPPDTLLRILETALDAPLGANRLSWRVILITSLALRSNIVAAMQAIERRDAHGLLDDSGQDMSRSCSLERMTEAPVHLAVTYDLRSDNPPERHLSSMPETAIVSSCLAIQNMWLAASAKGLGIEWVDLPDQNDVAQLLEIPTGVQLIAYLCLGIPQEFHTSRVQKAIGWHHGRTPTTTVYKNVWGEPHDLIATAMTS